MDIEIRGRHLDITPEIRRYVEERAERFFRYFDRLHSVQFILSRQGINYRAEVVVAAPRAGQLVAEAAEEGLNAAVDRVIDKMDRQVRRFKEKLKDHHRDEGRALQRDETGAAPSEDADEPA